MKKFILIVFTVCMSVLQLYSQSSFSQKTLLEDLDQFFYIVENSHPDPYSGFGGKMQFNKEVQRIRKAIPKEGLSKTGFQNILQLFLQRYTMGIHILMK